MITPKMNHILNFDTFYAQYQGVAEDFAKRTLTKLKSTFSHWDTRIDDDIIIVSAVDNALLKTHKAFDPDKGNIAPYLSRIVHNEVINELEKELKALNATTNGDMTSAQENDIIKMIERIPDDVMDDLENRLRMAIGMLPEKERIILSLYLDNPNSYAEEASQRLNISKENVYLRKTRILSKIPSLMGVSREDYQNMHETYTPHYMGFLTVGQSEALPGAKERLASKLYDIICQNLSKRDQCNLFNRTPDIIPVNYIGSGKSSLFEVEGEEYHSMAAAAAAAISVYLSRHPVEYNHLAGLWGKYVSNAIGGSRYKDIGMTTVDGTKVFTYTQFRQNGPRANWNDFVEKCKELGISIIIF